MKPISKEEWEKIKEKESLLNEIGRMLKVSSNQIVDKLNKLISENEELKKEISDLNDKHNKA